MRKKYIYILLAAFVSLSYSQRLSNRYIHNAILQGIDETVKQNYDSAKQIYTDVIKKYPKHPAGYIYLAAVMQAQYVDYDDIFNEDLYDSLLDKGMLYAERMSEKGNEKDWGYYFLGCAHAYRSFREADSGNLPLGIIHGVKAANNMERCLNINPNFYAAMSVLGAYYYWKSTLSWLPVISDRTVEGITLVKNAIDNSDYEYLLGKNILINILTSEGEYAEAERIDLELLANYPDNRNLLWMLMGIYEKSKNQRNLESIVAKLLQSIMEAPVINRYREATCRLKLATYAAAKGDTTTVELECQKIIQLTPYLDKTKLNLKKKITLAEDLIDSLQKN